MMLAALLALASLGTLSRVSAEESHRIEGIVVNGTRGDTPVAGAEIVLRAGDEKSLSPVAKTIADASGRFAFDNIPVEPGIVYLPGANYQGIHYPGVRVRPQSGGTVSVTLTVFDTVASPSPLVAEQHDIAIRVTAGALEVTETLRINNPSRTTYVGEATGDRTTLALAIPEGFERVTFSSEFHGRRFAVADKAIVTDIPWTPGRRELRFSYQLPVEGGHRLFERELDLPSSVVRASVRGDIQGQVTCNLARAQSLQNGDLLFESASGLLPRGHRVTLHLGHLPTPWIVHARWGALAFLVLLALVTVVLLRRRRPLPGPPSRKRVSESSLASGA